MTSIPLLHPLEVATGHGGGNAPAELILVSLLLLVFWGAFRVTRRKRS